MGVCDLWPVAEPSQNKRRNARRQRTERRGKQYVIARGWWSRYRRGTPYSCISQLTSETTKQTNSAPPNRHLNSLLMHAFGLRALGFFGLCVVDPIPLLTDRHHWPRTCASICLFLGMHFSPHHDMDVKLEVKKKEKKFKTQLCHDFTKGYIPDGFPPAYLFARSCKHILG